MQVINTLDIRIPTCVDILILTMYAFAYDKWLCQGLDTYNLDIPFETLRIVLLLINKISLVNIIHQSILS